MKRLALLFLVAFLSGNAFADLTVVSCKLGSKTGQLVRLNKTHVAADTGIYEIQINGRTTSLFEDENLSRGFDVHARCLGGKTKALLVYGEFTANAIQGSVFALNPVTGQVERLDFAERTPPKWLVLDDAGIQLFFETGGLGETNKPRLEYQHPFGSKQDPDPKGVEAEPDPRNAIRIR